MAKAKYYDIPDSELVPWGKGEKQPGEGDEIEPETILLTRSRSPAFAGWRRAYWRMSQRVYIISLSKEFHSEGVAKASVKSAFADYLGPEARRACHDQGEPRWKAGGGPNPWAVQHSGMSCGKEWKANRAWE